jgi:hypothetical protein
LLIAILKNPEKKSFIKDLYTKKWMREREELDFLGCNIPIQYFDPYVQITTPFDVMLNSERFYSRERNMGDCSETKRRTSFICKRFSFSSSCKNEAPIN